MTPYAAYPGEGGARHDGSYGDCVGCCPRCLHRPGLGAALGPEIRPGESADRSIEVGSLTHRRRGDGEEELRVRRPEAPVRNCEPLVIRLAESCDFAARRICSLAERRKWGEYAAVRDIHSHWLLGKSSEIISTAHALLEPLALSNLSARVSLLSTGGRGLPKAGSTPPLRSASTVGRAGSRLTESSRNATSPSTTVRTTAERSRGDCSATRSTTSPSRNGRFTGGC